jgi:hypothetical protein
MRGAVMEKWVSAMVVGACVGAPVEAHVCASVGAFVGALAVCLYISTGRVVLTRLPSAI